MTNYDRIRNMSIEEMAKVIRCPKGYDTDLEIDGCPVSDGCKYCRERWLESEVTE